MKSNKAGVTDMAKYILPCIYNSDFQTEGKDNTGYAKDCINSILLFTLRKFMAMIFYKYNG